MTAPSIAQLRILVDRAERGPLSPAEAAAFRAGLAALDAARRSSGGAQAAARALREQLARAARERDDALRELAAIRAEALSAPEGRAGPAA